MSMRRRFALAIRLRQELARRRDALLSAPRWRHADDAMAAPDAALLLADSARALAPHLDMPSDARRDARHDGRRDAHPLTLHGADGIIAEADAALAGRLHLLGADIEVPTDPDGWRRHPLSGVATARVHWHRLSYLEGASGGDIKLLWELNRHAHLVRLAQAWRLTRDERYATALVERLGSWMRGNPPGVGINWASALEVGFRAIAWCWCWRLAGASPAWRAPVIGEFLWQLGHHARHVARYDSIHHSPNTHLTGEALALAYVGSCFPSLSGALAWRRHGFRILRSEIAHQVLADGMHFERCTGYHKYTLEFYLHAALLARWSGDREAQAAFERALHRLVDVAVALRMPDGRWPVLGDEDGGTMLRLTTCAPTDMAPLIAAASVVLQRTAQGDVREAVREPEAWDAARWLTGQGEPRDRARGETAAGGARWLADGGYARLDDESGGPVTYCLVDVGPHGGERTGHAHSDIGHVELVIDGVPVLADPGSPTYGGDGSLRAWSRSENAHAMVVLPDAPLAEARGPFGWRRVPPPPVVQVRDADGYAIVDMQLERPGPARAVHHRRRVVLVRGAGVLIVDDLSTDDAATVRLALHWPVPHPVSAIAIDAHEVHVAGSAVIRLLEGSAATPQVQAAVHSPAYGERLPGALVTWTSELRGRCRLSTWIGAPGWAVTLEESAASLRVVVQRGGTAQRVIELAPQAPPREAR